MSDPQFAGFIKHWLSTSISWPTDWFTLGALAALQLKTYGCEWLNMKGACHPPTPYDEYLTEEGGFPTRRCKSAARLSPFEFPPYLWTLLGPTDLFILRAVAVCSARVVVCVSVCLC